MVICMSLNPFVEQLLTQGTAPTEGGGPERKGKGIEDPLDHPPGGRSAASRRGFFLLFWPFFLFSEITFQLFIVVRTKNQQDLQSDPEIFELDLEIDFRMDRRIFLIKNKGNH